MFIVRLQRGAVLFLVCAIFRAGALTGNSNFQIIAYYTAPNAYSVRQILTNGAAPLLTQINFAFGKVEGGRCAIENPERDLLRSYTAQESVDGSADHPEVSGLRGAFHQLQLLKSRYPKLKVLISLGGWGGSAGFSSAASSSHRSAFVASCVDLFIKGNFGLNMQAPGLFDGIDIDWEYPVGGGLQPGSREDRENYNLLLKELRRQMDAVRPGLLLSVALPAEEEDFKNFDLKTVGALVDQVQLMGYDLHWNTEPITNFHSALYHDPADPSPPNLQSRYGDFAVRQFLAAGVPASKIMLGVPFYGKGYAAVEDTNHGLFEPSHGPAKREGSYRALRNLPGEADRQFHAAAGSCTIWYQSTFWSYDCPQAMALKRRYARENSLGGIMFWELSEDSADGDLLRAIAGISP